MPVDPAMPVDVPPVTPSAPAERDLDPDACDDEDYREETREHEHDKEQRPDDWNEPPSAQAPKPDQPTPLSDDLR